MNDHWLARRQNQGRATSSQSQKKISMRIAAKAFVLLLFLLATSCTSPLLDERFLSNRLTNWTVVDDPDTVEIPSDWRVEADDWLHQRSNIWGRRGDFLGRWYGTFLVAGSPDWTNYRFSLKALPMDDDGFGVVFRYQDSEHFYRLLIINDTLSGGPLTRLDKRDGADYTELWSEERGFRKDAQITIEVLAVGNTIRIRIDGQQLLQVSDDAYRKGKIGLFCYAQSHQAFDDVRVLRE
jgi:hypothetical protein